MTTPAQHPHEPPVTRLELSRFSPEVLAKAVEVLATIAKNFDTSTPRARERYETLGVLAAHVAHADRVHGVMHQEPTPLADLDGTLLDGLGRLIWHAANTIAKNPDHRPVADVLWIVAGAALDLAAAWRVEDDEMQEALHGVGEFVPEDRLIAPHVDDNGDVVAGYIDANGNRLLGYPLEERSGD